MSRWQVAVLAVIGACALVSLHLFGAWLNSTRDSDDDPVRVELIDPLVVER